MIGYLTALYEILAVTKGFQLPDFSGNVAHQHLTRRLSNLSDLSLRLAIKEPQVYFKANGHAAVRGYGALLRWRLPLRVVVAPRAAEGELALDFVEGVNPVFCGWSRLVAVATLSP